jgi:hypothetical protein
MFLFQTVTSVSYQDTLENFVAVHPFRQTERIPESRVPRTLDWSWWSLRSHTPGLLSWDAVKGELFSTPVRDIDSIRDVQ